MLLSRLLSMITLDPSSYLEMKRTFHHFHIYFYPHYEISNFNQIYKPYVLLPYPLFRLLLRNSSHEQGLARYLQILFLIQKNWFKRFISNRRRIDINQSWRKHHTYISKEKCTMVSIIRFCSELVILEILFEHLNVTR